MFPDMKPTINTHGLGWLFFGRSNLVVLIFGVILVSAGFVAGRLNAKHSTDAIPLSQASAPVDPVPDDRQVEAAAPPPSAPPPMVSAPSAPSGWDEKAWQELTAAPGTMARNAQLAEMLEKLAATDPERAMALAKAEKNLVFRNSLINSTLHGWARLEPR